MKILELNFERTWRGGERQTLYNMIGFRNAGLEVDLMCRKGFPLEQQAKKEGFTVHSFRNIFGVILYLLFSSGKYKVLHAQASHILTYCVFTKPFHRAKVIFTRRVDFVPKGSLTKLKYKLTNRIVAVSTAVKNILEKFVSKDVVVISDIAVKRELNKSRALQWIDELKLLPGTYLLGTTAALVPHKDPLNMVEAIRLLSQTRSDFIFLHFGSGDLENAVKEKIKEYDLENVYKLMGFQKDVEDIFSVLDVFVMSSQEEGLGSSVLDAFLYKVPVVSTDAGGLLDLMKEGRGIMCRKRSPKMLADGIDLILKQSTLAKSITEKAFSYVIKYHSSEYITSQYLDIFK